MITRRAQNQVKETLKQPLQTRVSIDWLPCVCIDAASYHEVCKKYCTYLSRDSKLEVALPCAIGVPLESNQKAAWQSNLKDHQCNTKCYVYIYIYHLCNSCISSTYIVIKKMKYPLTQ